MRARKTTLMRSRATTLLNYTALFSSRFVHPRTFKFFRSLFTTFSRAMSPCMDAFSYWCFEPSQPQRITSGLLHGRCLFFFLPWLAEFSGVVLDWFSLSRQTTFYGRVTHTTGRHAHTIVEDNRLFKVMGQEFLQHILSLRVTTGSNIPTSWLT